MEEALTDTLSRVAGEAGAGVALESFLPVTGQHRGAGLSLLTRTHLAAPAAVQHQRDSCGAFGSGSGAKAGPVTQLTKNLWEKVPDRKKRIQM